MTIPKIKIGDVAKINPRPSRVPQLDEMVSFAGMTDLSAERGCITQSALRPFAEVCKGYTPFHAQDILVAKITPCFENCKIGEASIPTDIGYGSTEFHVIRPLPARLDRRYLLHFLRQARILKTGERRMTGSAGQRRVPASFLEALEIPLPPLEEQRRIAAIMDKASSLSSRLACAVQLEDEFNASLFEELVGDPVVNVKDFPRVRLADLCASADDIKCGPFGTQLKQHEFRSTGVPLWGIKHVNRRFEIATSEFLEEDTATRLSAYSLEPGDIVMTRKGTVGNCSVYPDRLPSGVMHSDLLRIRLDETRCLPSFAAYQLHHSTDIKRQIDLISGGAIMAGINVGRLKEVKIVLPSLDIQKEFESLASRGSWLVWQKNQGMIRRSRELLQSLSGSFFLGSQSGQTKT
jgi:type I restriction enzyme, S subunit